jgi:hypothetical protein
MNPIWTSRRLPCDGTASSRNTEPTRLPEIHNTSKATHRWWTPTAMFPKVEPSSHQAGEDPGESAFSAVVAARRRRWVSSLGGVLGRGPEREEAGGRRRMGVTNSGCRGATTGEANGLPPSLIVSLWKNGEKGRSDRLAAVSEPQLIFPWPLVVDINGQ